MLFNDDEFEEWILATPFRRWMMRISVAAFISGLLFFPNWFFDVAAMITCADWVCPR